MTSPSLANLIPQFLREVGEYVTKASVGEFHIKKAKLGPQDTEFDHLTTRPTDEEIEGALLAIMAINEARARVRTTGPQLAALLESVRHDSSSVLMATHRIGRGEGPERIASLLEQVTVELQRVLLGKPAEAVGDATKLEARKPKPRGRPKANYETCQREAKLAADWKRAKSAGVAKREFAVDNGMSFDEFDTLLDRVAFRNRHSE